MEQVETRELRYFVALAEELHFGRAAQRLGIAQPPLSRAIRQLERRLGVTLVERTSRAVRLTSAGEVLLREGRAALDAVAAATRRAQRAGRAGAHLVLAMKPGGDGGLLPYVLAEYESLPGSIPVEIVFSVGERAAMLRDGRADVGLLHTRKTISAGWTGKNCLPNGRWSWSLNTIGWRSVAVSAWLTWTARRCRGGRRQRTETAQDPSCTTPARSCN
jgi:DNA-binding transcriptional LysR family regulator